MNHVFYYNYYGRPVFAETLREHGITLTELRPDATEAEADAVIGRSHAYQISSGVNDMPAHYQARAPLLDRAPNLLVVSAVGAGFDTIDVAACTERGILAINQSGGANAQAVVEHTLAMMLSLTTRLAEADHRMRRPGFISRHDYTGSNIQGKTVGIIGYGHVGKQLARTCKLAFDMRVLVCSGRQPDDDFVEWTALHDMLPQCDFVAVCCSLTDETRNMIGATEFALMPPHAYFITTARGGIHDEQALITALERKQIAGAGVDVWDVEPPPNNHPLLKMDNVVASPHIAGATVESRLEASRRAADRIVALLRGNPPERVLNPEAWEAFRARFERITGCAPQEPAWAR